MDLTQSKDILGDIQCWGLDRDGNRDRYQQD